MPLHHIVYGSKASQPFAETELADLLRHSREYNEAYGLSGVLLCTPDGQFLQVLEGDVDDVYELYFRHIFHDPRHQQCTLLADSPLDRRRFPDWRMGFRPTTSQVLATLAGYINTSSVASALPLLPANLPGPLLDKLLDYVQDTVANPVLEEIGLT